MNVRTSKKGTATLDMGFIVQGREELNAVLLRSCVRWRALLDIERTTG